MVCWKWINGRLGSGIFVFGVGDLCHVTLCDAVTNVSTTDLKKDDVNLEKVEGGVLNT